MAGDHLLGFDYGEKTIGVAVGNTHTRQAHPLTTLRVVRGQPDWGALNALVEEWRPAALVVGLPLNMDGSDNPVTPAARKFGNRLQGRYNLPVHMVDERLTTRNARTDLVDAGVSVRHHTALLDKLAAQTILQSYLNELPGADRESGD
jgi:putative Holliday junction resolvase